jgi:ribosomal-protein-alanine N-acetyltransferase
MESRETGGFLGAIVEEDGMNSIFKGNPRLGTVRLMLRKLKLSDAEDIFAYSSDPEVTKYLLWDTHDSIEDSENFIRYTMERYDSGDAGEWGIVLKETGKLIGTIGFPWYDLKNRRAEIGYVLSRDCWGNGYMPEAAGRILQFAFEEMNMNRIESCHFLPNEKSGKVMQKCGLKFEGTAHQKVFVKEKFWDVQQYAILKEVWVKAHPAITLTDEEIEAEKSIREKLL